MSFSNHVHISDAHFWSMLCFFIICVLVDGFNFIRALGTVVKVVLSVPKKIISVNLTVIIITTLFLQIYMWLNSVFASSSFCVPEPVLFLTNTLMALFSILITAMVHMFIVVQQSESIHNDFTFLTKTTTTAIPTQPIAEDRIAIADVFATQRC